MSDIAITNAVLQLDGQTVRLTTSSQTSGTYTVYVTNVTDIVGNVVNPAFDNASFLDTILPQLLSATSIDGTTIRLVFDDLMDPAGGGGIDLPANYTFSGAGQIAAPLVIDHINIIDAATVDLITTGEMLAGVDNYTVTVANVTDINGNIIDPVHDDDTFNGILFILKVVSGTATNNTTIDVLFNAEVIEALAEDVGNYDIQY